MKLLIATPTYAGKDYALEKWIDCLIAALEYTSEDIEIHNAIADNSADRKHLATLKDACEYLYYINPKNKSGAEVLCESYNKLRNKAVLGNYDWMLTLESDVMLHADTLVRMYARAHAHGLPILSAAYQTNQDFALCVQKPVFTSPTHVDIVNCSVSDGYLLLDGELKEVYGAGLGCTLIHRSVFENIPFRTLAGTNLYPDALWYEDVMRAKVPIFLDTSIILEHWNQDWSNVYNFKIKSK